MEVRRYSCAASRERKGFFCILFYHFLLLRALIILRLHILWFCSIIWQGFMSNVALCPDFISTKVKFPTVGELDILMRKKGFHTFYLDLNSTAALRKLAH